MKKIVFSTLAIVAFAGSSFASTGVKSECAIAMEAQEKPCNIYVQVIDKDGRKLHLQGEGGTTTLIGCGEFMDKWLGNLKEQGYRFNEADAQLHWG